ncbi:bifunctional methylenetetrahydrofolate dehydrogenase/cyclohydrolase 2, mitochondrial-like [Gastrophryne carolinensis]
MASIFILIRFLQRTKYGIAKFSTITLNRSCQRDTESSSALELDEENFSSNLDEYDLFAAFISFNLITVKQKLQDISVLLAANTKVQTFTRSKAQIISGTKLAKEIKTEIQEEIESLLQLGYKRPHLSVILVGDNPASHTYVRNKIKAATAVGISSEVVFRPSNITQEELLDVISKLNRNPSVSGLLVQLPLPEHINERDVCNAVVPEKDIDGFHIVNVGKLCLDQPSIIPATAAAVWEIIKRTGIETFGKNVVVAGRSKNVGLPIAMLMHTDGRHKRPGGDATVTIAHRYTPRELLKSHTQLADIIIAAAGIPKLVTADMIKEGAAIIDVGINHIEDPATGKTMIVGDVDLEGVKEKAGFVTPVPGGVGPMTVAMLLKNTLMAAKKII